VNKVYRKTTEISISALDNSVAITLMSTDVERIVLSMQVIHEIWANILQLGIGIFLLERQLGVACVAPLVVSLGMSIYLQEESSIN
jgi:hypothetical protein